MCREYLLRLEQLKVEVKLMEESSFLDEDLRKGSSSVLVEGRKKKASGRSEDKHDGTVEEMSNNFVRLRNENSSMVLCLRNRAMKMKDCAYDLNQKERSLGQFMNNEEIMRQEIEEIKFNECKFKRRLDMVRREKKDLVELLIWLKSSNDYVSRVERLVNQRTDRQGIMSIKRQVNFGQDLEKLLEQRAPCVIRILPRKRGFLSQDFSSSNYVYALIPGENLIKKAISVGENDSSINNRGNSDNFSVKQHEKVWSRMLGCLDQEIAVQKIMQAGLSSIGIGVNGNNSQDDQKVEA